MAKPNYFASSFKPTPDLSSFDRSDLKSLSQSHRYNEFLLQEQDLNTSQHSKPSKYQHFSLRDLDEMIISPFSLQSTSTIAQNSFHYGVSRRDSPVRSFHTDRVNFYGNENIPIDWAHEFYNSDWAREIDESILSTDSLIARSTPKKGLNGGWKSYGIDENGTNLDNMSNIKEKDTIKSDEKKERPEETILETVSLPNESLMPLSECFEEAEVTDIFGLGSFDSVFITEQDIEKARQKLTNEDFKTNEATAAYLFDQLVTFSDNFYKPPRDESCILSTIQDVSLCNNFTVLAQATLHLTATHLSFTLTTLPHYLFQPLTDIPIRLSFKLSNLSDVRIKEVELDKPRDTLLFTICEGRAFCASLFNEGIKGVDIRKLEGLMKVCVKRAKEEDDGLSAGDFKIPESMLTSVTSPTSTSASFSTSVSPIASPLTTTPSAFCSASLPSQTVISLPTKLHTTSSLVLSPQQKSNPVTNSTSTIISQEADSIPSATTSSNTVNPKGTQNVDRSKLTASTATHASNNDLVTKPNMRAGVVSNLSTKSGPSSLPVLSRITANKGSKIPCVTRRVENAPGLRVKSNKLNVRVEKIREIAVGEEKTDYRISKKEVKERKDQLVENCIAQTEEDEEYRICLTNAIQKRDLVIANAHEEYKAEVARLHEELQQRMAKRRRISENEGKEVDLSNKSIGQPCDEEIFMEICTNECRLCFAEEESREFLPCAHRLCAACCSRIQQIAAEKNDNVTIKCPWCRSDVASVKIFGD